MCTRGFGPAEAYTQHAHFTLQSCSPHTHTLALTCVVLLERGAGGTDPAAVVAPLALDQVDLRTRAVCIHTLTWTCGPRTHTHTHYIHTCTRTHTHLPAENGRCAVAYVRTQDPQACGLWSGVCDAMKCIMPEITTHIHIFISAYTRTSALNYITHYSPTFARTRRRALGRACVWRRPCWRLGRESPPRTETRA
jgi:hypothetical protein